MRNFTLRTRNFVIKVMNFAETDAPFMAPDKVWCPVETGIGRRKNEPAAMPAVCRAAASAMGVRAEELARASTANAERFFRLRERHTALQAVAHAHVAVAHAHVAVGE